MTPPPTVTLGSRPTCRRPGERSDDELSVGEFNNIAATDDLSLSLNCEKYKSVFTSYSKEGKSEGKVEHEWKVEEGE